MKHITILGDGSWGTACAALLAHNQINVTLWCYNEEVATNIQQHRENRTFLPGVTLDTQYIHPTTSHKEAVHDASHICFAIPVKYLRAVLENCQPYIQSGQTWVSLSKGIEQKTGLLPTQIIDDIAPTSIHTGVIAGPSFARELAEHKPTGLLCAMHEHHHAQPLMDAFDSDFTTIMYHHDVIGSQIGGALKNIYALASGIIDATTESRNTVALLTTQAFTEMQRISTVFGGHTETIASLAGLGDLMLTCHGSQSRNRTVGHKIGSGTTLEAYLDTVDFVPEGVNTVAAMYNILKNKDINAPIIHSVYEIVHNDTSADQLITTLLRRQ